MDLNELGFTLLPIPMPPQLPEALEFPEGNYVSVTYEATNCYTFDGRFGQTTSYWVYSAWIEHLAMKVFVGNYDFGSDDDLPTHALLVDKELKQIWVGEYDKVRDFLRQFKLSKKQKITIEESQKFWEIYHELMAQQKIQLQKDIESGKIDRQIKEKMAKERIAVESIKEFLDGYLQDAYKECLQKIQKNKRSGDFDLMLVLNLHEFQEKLGINN